MDALSGLSTCGPEPLDARDRALVAAMWLGRAESEARAAIVFGRLAEDLATLDAPQILRDLAARAVGEEVEHARICAVVASAYRGVAVAPPVPAPFEIVEFVAAPTALRPLLRVLVSCALSESTATMFLERVRAAAQAPIVREATRLLMRDEVDHARIGWGLLAAPTIDADTRAALGAWLPTLCEMTLRLWRTRPRLDTPHDLRAHGCLPWDEVDTCVVDALATLVLPGFALLGIDDVPARRWLECVGPGEAPGRLQVGTDGRVRLAALG